MSQNSYHLDVDAKFEFGFEHFGRAVKPVSVLNRRLNPFGKSVFRMFTESANQSLISEDSMSRTFRLIQDKNKSFAIITAYRRSLSPRANILCNRKLRDKLNSEKMGVHQLVGHWQEAPEGREWSECKPSELTDVVERSYLVVKRDDMTDQDFALLMRKLMKIDWYEQDAILIRFASKGDEIYLLSKSGQILNTFTQFVPNKIAQAYSQHVLNLSVPFVFEGEEIPDTNTDAKAMHDNNIVWS